MRGGGSRLRIGGGGPSREASAARLAADAAAAAAAAAEAEAALLAAEAPDSAEAAIAAAEAARLTAAAAAAAAAAETLTRVRFPDDDAEAPIVGHGFWRGRFSNIKDEEGNPRLVGATLDGQFNHLYGDADFTGYLIADSTAHAGRDVSGDDRIVRESKEILNASDTPPEIPLFSLGKQAPIIDLENTRYVGANVVPHAETAELFTAGESFGEVETSSGWVLDGTSVDRVIEFLEPHLGIGTSRAGDDFTYTLGYTGLPTFVGPARVTLGGRGE